MESWGFDAEAMDEWDLKNGVTKPINIDPNTRAGRRALARLIDSIRQKER
jgi:hypothetical protein